MGLDSVPYPRGRKCRVCGASDERRLRLLKRLLFSQVLIALAVFALGVRPSQAVPLLQLDIEGGVYQTASVNGSNPESIVATGSVFTLYALLTPSGGNFSLDDLLNDFYYISAAVTPKTLEPGGDFGSFLFDGAEAVDQDLNGDGVWTDFIDIMNGEGDVLPIVEI